jgi:hypothetical protein
MQGRVAGWAQRLTLGAAMAAIPGLGGCATANRAVGGAAKATAAAAQATASAASTVATTTTDLLYTILPFNEPNGPEKQREQMLEVAGPKHFRNDDFAKARYELRSPGSEFQTHRNELVFEDLTDAKAHFRNGNKAPKGGLILGGPNVDPDVARALILAAASQGVPLVGVQPVLAQLLPAFGN